MGTPKIFTSILLTLLLFSCKAQTNDTFKNKLNEKRIGKSNYYISIPSNYKLKLANGIDFSVYYFSPIDTTHEAKFSGGLYFGNFPNEFEPDNDSCKTTTIQSKILDSVADWTVYKCGGKYSLQTIIDSKSGEDWNEKIHAFGGATSEEGIRNVLGIYTTLKKKKK
jgi:hypothetical protein